MNLSQYRTWVIWSISQTGDDAAIWGDVMVATADEAKQAFLADSSGELMPDHIYFVTDISETRLSHEVTEEVNDSLSKKGFTFTEEIVKGFVSLMRSSINKPVLN